MALRRAQLKNPFAWNNRFVVNVVGDTNSLQICCTAKDSTWQIDAQHILIGTHETKVFSDTDVCCVIYYMALGIS